MIGRAVQFVSIVVAIMIIISVPDEVVDGSIKIQLVLFAVSIGVALVGIHLGLDARRIFMERRDAINRYERPHVVDVLEVLFSDVVQTKALVKKMNGGDAGVENVRVAVYARIDRHVSTERQIASRFLEIGLADLHTRLDPAFKSLGEVVAIRAFDDKSIAVRLDDAMSAVALAISNIKNAPPL